MGLFRAIFDLLQRSGSRRRHDRQSRKKKDWLPVLTIFKLIKALLKKIVLLVALYWTASLFYSKHSKAVCLDSAVQQHFWCSMLVQALISGTHLA